MTMDPSGGAGENTKCMSYTNYLLQLWQRHYYKY